MKNKPNYPISDYSRKFRRYSQPKQNNNLPTKINTISNQISEIYNSLYEDLFPSILCLSKTTFLEKINKQAKDSLSLVNFQEYQSTTNIKLITRIKEDIIKKYDNDYKILSTEYQNFLKNGKNYKYLTHFRKHCVQTDNIALHSCSNKKQGKFIEIKNKINNKEEISYVICTECKQCYLSNFIFMVCVPCNKKYFSNVLEESENQNILPATWEKYHCGPMINEIMKCIKCHNILYLNLKTKELVCQNKKCNFISKPESILWKCFICSNDFRSRAKIYNPLEFQILKKAINFAILLKKKASPKQLPCGCEKDISKLTFFHKEECKGELYKGILIDKEIIVCSQCHAINFEEKFTWICPICSTKFHLHSMVGCKPFSKKKYIINREFHQSVKTVSKKNKFKDKKEKNMNNINLYQEGINLEKSINDSNYKNKKNQNSIEISNQSIKRGDFLSKKEPSQSPRNMIRENYSKSLINLKRSKNCPNTAEKRNKHYSTLLDILQERKQSQPKKNNREESKCENNSELNKFNHKNSSPINHNKNFIRNKKDNLYYKNKTSDNNYNLLTNEKLEKYLKDNLKENNNNIINVINNKYEEENSPENKEVEIKVNKRFHSKINQFDKIINDNNKQKEIIKARDSTDFSSLKTLSSNEYKTKNNLYYSISSSKRTSNNPLNVFRYRNKKANTNNNKSKELEAFRSSKVTNQFSEISDQDIISDLRFSKLNVDTYNSSCRISQFNSTSNEIKDNSKININNININETSEEISEIGTKDNKLIYDLGKNEEENEKEKEENNINKENNDDLTDMENKDDIISLIEKKISKKLQEVQAQVEEQSEKSENNDDNKDEMNDKFEEIPLFPMCKKNVRESFILNNDFMFQNVLISQDKLNSLSSETNVPSFNETDYNFLKPIGEGTYGVVYLVENKVTYEQFALKKIVCRDYNELIKHKNELELIYSVKHENILGLCGIQFKYLDETTSAIYVLMELAQNDWNLEIKRRILAKKYYKENEIILILKQIIKGFLFLQEKNIAHRDIKPQNILLFPNNIYKIADFGEAKNIKNIAQQSTLRGSELYMSPVLYKGYKFNKKNIMHNPYKSDVFSLGYCLLYAICLNLKVLEAVRELTTMRSIITSINKYIAKNKYSDKLMNLIYKMIDPNEDQRFDFEDLSIELDKNF